MCMVWYVFLFTLGCLFFPGLFHFFRKWMKHFTYGVDMGNVINVTVSVKAVSAVQAALAITCGLIITTNCKDDLIYQRHWLTNSYATFGVPYMIYDVYAMFVMQCTKKPHLQTMSLSSAIKDYMQNNPAIVIHHLAIAAIAYPFVMFLRNGKGDFFLGCFYAMEMSNPFLYLRTVLKLIGWEKSKLYLINGALIIVSYFCCRLLMFPFIYHVYGRTKNLTLWEVARHIPVQCNVGCFIVFAFQAYWFCLILVAAGRTVKRVNSGQMRNGPETYVDGKSTNIAPKRD